MGMCMYVGVADGHGGIPSIMYSLTSSHNCFMWCSDKYLQFFAASSHSSGPALGFSRAGPGWGTDGSTIVGTQPQRGTTVIDVAVQLLGMAVLSYLVSRRSSSAEKARRGLRASCFVAVADVDLAAVSAWFVLRCLSLVFQ